MIFFYQKAIFFQKEVICLKSQIKLLILDHTYWSLEGTVFKMLIIPYCLIGHRQEVNDVSPEHLERKLLWPCNEFFLLVRYKPLVSGK